jgi:hypothetical protein
MAHLYQLSGYADLINDTTRTDAYVRALRAAVTPESVVLDLGAGPGLFSLLACQMGARRVFAIEHSPVIQLAREAAIANGFRDRIEFYHGMSTEVVLPERANVMISDLHGPLPYYEEHIPVIRDARKRLLTEDCVLIPERDLLWAAIVEAPHEYEQMTAAWGPHYGIDLSGVRSAATNSWVKRYLVPENLLCEPVHFHTVDYYSVEQANLYADISLSIRRTGVAHAIAVWFDSHLLKGITFSNAPGGEKLIFGNGIFFFPDSVHVSEGDQVAVNLTAHLRADYIWSWNTRIFANGDKTRCKADFRQSTFLGMPFLPEEVKKRAATHAPKLNGRGHIQSWLLSRMDGAASLEDLAKEIMQQFPNSFSDYSSALTHVAQVSTDYSE